MRNLKKVLALALAVVMLVGMMAMGASAAYADVENNDHGVAIEVVSAIKALEGSNGNFRPDGRLTRADGAVIAARVALERGVADKLVGASGVYTDVSAKHYASGAIAWATNEGYLSGDGTGAFNPNGSLYGIHFAKMLLGVLGWNAEAEGFTGAGYVQKIILAAAQAGLLEGLEDVELNGRITRAQAAQMAFNAIVNGEKVTYDSFLTTVNGQLTTTYVREVDAENYFLKTKYDLTYAPAVMDAGVVEGGYWYTHNAQGRVVAVSTAAEIPASVTLNKFTSTTVLNNTYATKGYTLDVGSELTWAELSALTGTGVSVALWINSAKEIVKIERTTEELSTVVAIDTNRDDVIVAIETSDDTYNAIAANNTNPTAAQKAEAAMLNALIALDLEVGDKLVATKVDGVVVSYALPGTAVVTVSKFTKDTAGNINAVNDVAVSATAETIDTVMGGKYTLYLDSNGNVLANAIYVEDVEEIVPDYMYVLAGGYEMVRGQVTNYFIGVDMLGNVHQGTFVSAVDTDGVTELLTSITLTALNDWEDVETIVEFAVEDGVYAFADAEIDFVNADEDIAAGDLLFAVETEAYFFAPSVEVVYMLGLDAEGNPELNPSTINTVPAIDSAIDMLVFYTEDALDQKIVTRLFLVDVPAGAAPEAPVFEDGTVIVKEDIEAVDYYKLAEDAEGNEITLGSITVLVDGVETEMFVPSTFETLAAGLYKVVLDENNAITDIVTLQQYLNAVAAVTADDEAYYVLSDLTASDFVYVNGKYYLAGDMIDITNVSVLDVAESEDGIVNTVAALYRNLVKGDTVNTHYVVKTVNTVAGAVVTVENIIVVNYEKAE